MLMFTLGISYVNIQFTLIHGSNIPASYAVLFFIASDFTFTTRHIHNWVLFLPLHSHSGPLPTWGVHLSVLYLFAFSHCSWGSQGTDARVVCHSLLQWTTFCQNSPPGPVHLGWPYTGWLISFTELDKVVIHVISLVSFLWL